MRCRELDTFKILGEFFGNSWGILGELSMIVYIFKSQLVLTVSKSADCLHFQSQLIFYILKMEGTKFGQDFVSMEKDNFLGIL